LELVHFLDKANGIVVKACCEDPVIRARVSKGSKGREKTRMERNESRAEKRTFEGDFCCRKVEQAGCPVEREP
jgi:hypothetical protein